MADTASKQVPATYVGTSKVAQTKYPVSWDSIDHASDRIADLQVAHRQRPVRPSPHAYPRHTIAEDSRISLAREDWLTLYYRHFKRVVGYARPSDYLAGGIAAAAGPGLMVAMEKFQPSEVGRGGFTKALRLSGFIGLAGGFLFFYQRSIRT